MPVYKIQHDEAVKAVMIDWSWWWRWWIDVVNYGWSVLWRPWPRRGTLGITWSFCASVSSSPWPLLPGWCWTAISRADQGEAPPVTLSNDIAPLNTWYVSHEYRAVWWTAPHLRVHAWCGTSCFREFWHRSQTVHQVYTYIYIYIFEDNYNNGNNSNSSNVLWYGLGRPVITSEIGNWSVFVLLGWRFVFGIIMKWDGREPHIVRCHHDSGNNKDASLLRLLRLKVSNRQGLA